MADTEIIDLPLLTVPSGSELYGVKAGVDYRLAVGGANGLAVLSSTARVPTANLGTGTANTTTFLRGDGSWAAVPASGGTVTSVNITPGTGLAASGGPITTSGSISLSLSSNLQAWSALATSAKANTSHTHTVGNIVASGTPSSSTFLRGDGSWQAVPAGTGTVTSVNITPGTGVTASGGPVTSSGSITVGLSANLQAWSALATSAKANTSHTHAAADITSGVLSTARLGSGTANSTKYLRGDGTWQTLNATGTVTSVAVSGGSTGMSFGGSPVTTSGTMTMSGVLSVGNGGTGGSNAAGGRQGLGIYIQSSDPGAVPDGSVWAW